MTGFFVFFQSWLYCSGDATCKVLQSCGRDSSTINDLSNRLERQSIEAAKLVSGQIKNQFLLLNFYVRTHFDLIFQSQQNHGPIEIIWMQPWTPQRPLVTTVDHSNTLSIPISKNFKYTSYTKKRIVLFSLFFCPSFRHDNAPCCHSMPIADVF